MSSKIKKYINIFRLEINASSSQKCDILEPILMVVKIPHKLPAFELRPFRLKGENLNCLLVTEAANLKSNHSQCF